MAWVYNPATGHNDRWVQGPGVDAAGNPVSYTQSVPSPGAAGAAAGAAPFPPPLPPAAVKPPPSNVLLTPPTGPPLVSPLTGPDGKSLTYWPAGAPPVLAPGPVGGAGGQDVREIIKQLQAKIPASPAGFQELIRQLNAMGIRATAATHAGGSAASDDKLVLPSGEYFDIRTDNGWTAPGQANHWDPKVPIVTPSGQFQAFGDYMQSQGLPVPAFNPRPDEIGGGGGWYSGSSTGPIDLSAFNSPLLAPFTGSAPSFTAPTGLNYMNDPGFMERLKLGTDAIQNSAASKGTLLTGGTLKDLMQFGQDYASNEYGNVFNRALAGHNAAMGTFGANYDIYRNNQTDPFNKLLSLTGLGAGAASQQSGYDVGAGTDQANLAIGQGNVNAAATAAKTGGYQGALGNLSNWYQQYQANKPPAVPKPPPLRPGGGASLPNLPGYTTQLPTPPPVPSAGPGTFFTPANPYA